ncbi:FecR domain-containing protein [Pseudomonas sp. ABC1]|nr:FecR domain-containing protein [Pseudomonas sp. ABC1]
MQQAARWYARLNGEADDADTRQAWQTWLAEDDRHRSAWAYVERVSQRFQALQPGSDLHAQTLRQAGQQLRSRRQHLRTLALLLGAPVLGWLSWRHTALPERLSVWRADHRNASRVLALRLGDGSQAWLNSDSALNETFTTDLRHLALLRGEVLIDTARDPRPFIVETEQGRLRALGTRFSVRLRDGATQLSVFQGAVEIRPHDGGVHVVQAGEQSLFDRRSILDSGPAQALREGWSHGLLQASDTRLEELIAELAPHIRGHLGVAPEIADLRVMGTYPLHDPQQTLDMLASALPIRIARPLPWWTTLEAR